MSGGGSGGGGSTNTTVQTQKADPWVGQQQPLLNSYTGAMNAWNATPSSPFGGDLIADPNATQRGANAATVAAGGNFQTYGRGIRNFGDNLLADAVGQPYLPTSQEGANPNMLTSLDGSKLDIGSNPYLMPAMMGNIAQGANKIRDITLPELSTAAGAQGGKSAYGGTRQDFLKSQIISDFERNAADAIAQGTLGAYNTERGIQAGQEQQRYGASAARNTQADSLNTGRSNFLAQLSPTLMQQGMGAETQGLGLQSAAGQEQQGWSQDQLNEALQKYQMSVEAPWQGVKNYSAIIGGAIPGSSVNTMNAPSQSALSGLAGGGLGGAAIGGALGTMIGNPMLGLGAGALLGGLGGYFR